MHALAVTNRRHPFVTNSHPFPDDCIPTTSATRCPRGRGKNRTTRCDYIGRVRHASSPRERRSAIGKFFLIVSDVRDVFSRAKSFLREFQEKFFFSITSLVLLRLIFGRYFTVYGPRPRETPGAIGYMRNYITNRLPKENNICSNN